MCRRHIRNCSPLSTSMSSITRQSTASIGAPTNRRRTQIRNRKYKFSQPLFLYKSFAKRVRKSGSYKTVTEGYSDTQGTYPPQYSICLYLYHIHLSHQSRCRYFNATDPSLIPIQFQAAHVWKIDIVHVMVFYT